ncbi:hypothetical protein [Psychrobacillus sp. NPDC093180]
MKSIEKEYPILKEDRRRKESKNRNIKSLIILSIGLIGITVKIMFFS